jgi:hypothetical protein
LLLLKEAQTAMVSSTAVGIASKGGNVAERIHACISPILLHKKAVLSAFCVASIFLAFAVPGFSSIMKTISETPLRAVYKNALIINVVSMTESDTATKTRPMNELAQFISITNEGINIDQNAMLVYAQSAGLSENDVINVDYLKGVRPSWSMYYAITRTATFPVKDIQSITFMPFKKQPPIDAFSDFVSQLL